MNHRREYGAFESGKGDKRCQQSEPPGPPKTLCLTHNPRYSRGRSASTGSTLMHSATRTGSCSTRSTART